MARNRPGLVRAYKRVLGDGLALPLGAARELERGRAWAAYKAMAPEDFEAMAQFIAARKAAGGAPGRREAAAPAGGREGPAARARL